MTSMTLPLLGKGSSPLGRGAAANSRPFALLISALALLGTVETSASQVPGPLQVEIVGDTLVDEGDRVGYTIAPWTPVAEVAPTYQWAFGDGESVSRQEETAVGHRYMQDGEYTVTASDGTGTAVLQVTVRPARPVIDVLSHDVEWLPPGEPITFQAVARDPGADTLTYAWDFGDGSERKDRDLAEVTHDYEAPGEYSVTLVVTDEDGLEARRTILVDVNPGFRGLLAGDVDVPVEGVSGVATLMNAAGFGGPFTGAAPMGSGVADLSDAMDVCLVNAGFWDDTNKVHVNFQWTAHVDSIWTRGTYPVRWDHPGGGLKPDQMQVNALVLEIGSTYEDTKEGAESSQIVDPSAMANLLAGLSQFVPGGATSGPGRNWTLHADSGSVTISRVTPTRIRGRMSVDLMGAWVSGAPSESGQVAVQTIEGSFVWELDDVARANLMRCGDRPFQIASHTPKVEAEVVDYEVPRVSVSFTLPVARETVRKETLELGYVTSSGGFSRVETRIVFDENPTKVHLVPAEPLDDGVYHRVRVKGGEGGIRSFREDQLQEDYRWRFSTGPELVRRPDEGSK